MQFLKRKAKFVFCFTLIMMLSVMCAVNVSATQNRSKYFSTKYTLTGNQAQDVIAVARAQKNKKKASLKYTEAWCANFVLDCARLAKVGDKVIPYNYKSGGGCGYLYKYMMNKCNAKVITAKEAKPGDVVFYYCNKCKKYVHVGYYDGSGYFIEGNVGGKVLHYNTYYCDSKGHSVKGGTVSRIYVHPNYKKSMVDCAISLSATSFTYTGGKIAPSIVVKDAGKTLTSSDYSYTISNNVNAGTATITFTGKGSYAGTVKKTFKIVQKDISKAKFSSVSNKAYTGSQIKPSVTVKNGSTTLKNGTHYTVSYGANKSTGKATITITGKGNFKGTKTITFYVVPKKVTNVALKVSGKKITVSYKKATGATGYQIAYRKKGAKTWSYTTCSTTSKKITLKALTNYQVQVRAFVQVQEGSKVTKKYGSWSSIVSKTTLF